MAFDITPCVDFSGGLNTREAPYLIKENQVADCQNVTFREAGKVKTRKGHQIYKTLPAATGLTIIDLCDEVTGWSVDAPGDGSIGSDIERCDVITGWTGATLETATQYEGAGSLIIAFGVQAYKTYAFDFSDKAADDCVCLWAKRYSGTTSTVTLTFETSGGNYYSTAIVVTSATWCMKSVAKSAFTATGSPSWANITKIRIDCTLVNVGIDYIHWRWLKYQGTSSVKGVRPIGEIISDCDAATGWTGQDDIDTVTKYSGAGSVRDKVTLGEVLDTCDTEFGWTNTMQYPFDKFEGAASLNINAGATAYKTIAKDYSIYENDAVFNIYTKNAMGWFGQTITVVLETNPANYFYYSFSVYDTWQEYSCYKANFWTVGAPNWANITKISVVNNDPWHGILIDYIHWQENGRSNVPCTFTPVGMQTYEYLEGDTEFTLWFKPASAYWSTATVGAVLYDGADYFYRTLTVTCGSTNWQELKCKKSDFASAGSPSWTTIDSLKIDLTFSLPWYADPASIMYWYYDQIRWEELTIADVFTCDWSGAHKDYSGVGDDAEFGYWYRYHPTGYDQSVSLEIRMYKGVNYYTKTFTIDKEIVDSFQKLTCKRSDFTLYETPAWNDLDKMEVRVTHTLTASTYSATSLYYHFDYYTWQASSVTNSILGIYEFRDRNGTTVKEIACIGTKIYNLATLGEIQRVAGMTTGFDYTFATMNDKVFATNGTDKMQYWDGAAATFLDVGAGAWPAVDDTPPECKYIIAHQNRLFCFGCTLSGYESYLVWSKLGDPTIADQWPAANWMYVGADEGSVPTGTAIFSDALVLFKRKSLFVLFGTDEDNFNLKHFDECPGCIAPKSIAVSEDGVYYLGAKGVYLFDGKQSYLVSDNLRSTVLNDVFTDKLSDAVGTFYDGQYILWVVEKDGWSTEAYPDMALAFDPKMNCWERYRGMYFNVFGMLGDKLYGGGCTSPTVFKCLEGYYDEGRGDIESIIKTRQYNMGIPEMHKFFHHLYVVAESTADDYDLNVLAQTQEAAEQRAYDIALQDPDKEIVRDRHTISLRGDYLQLTFSHEGHNEPISLLGFSIGSKQKRVK